MSEERDMTERPERFLRSLPAGGQEATPRYAVWEITLACDLGCKHCGSRAGNARSEELSTEQCFDVVRQMEEVGIKEVTLIGGEAYLREDWDQIAAEISRRGMGCSMTTGGRALTDERIARAEAAGIRSISISIDGLERSHDMQRGAPGSWRAALASGERVSKSSIRLTTNTQVNRISMPELPALSQLLIDIGSKAWQVQLTVPMGRGADRPDMLLQPYDLLELFPVLLWMKRERLKPNGITLFPGNNVGYFGPFEASLRYGGERGAHWGGCGAGRGCIGVEADGKIKGCPSLPPDVYTGGHFGKDELRVVLDEAPEVNHIRLREGRESLWGFCKTCYYADVCKAGCTWTSHCTLGKAGNNPYCIHRAMSFEERGLRERLVRVAPPPGLPFDHGRFELVEEPWPEAPPEDAKMLDFPLTELLELDWHAGSVWDEQTLRSKLKRAPRLVSIGG